MMASIIAPETSDILKRIDFLSVRSALWVTIVDCHRDYDLEQEVHCIKLNRGQQLRILPEPPYVI